METEAGEEAAAQQAQLEEQAAVKESEKAAAKKAKKQRQKAKKQQEQQQQQQEQQDKLSAQHHTKSSSTTEARATGNVSQLQQWQHQARPSAQQTAEAFQLVQAPTNGDVSQPQQQQQQQQDKQSAQQRAQALQLQEAHAAGGISQLQQLQQQQPEAQLSGTEDQPGNLELQPDDKLLSVQLQSGEQCLHQMSGLPDVTLASFQQPERPQQQQQQQQQEEEDRGDEGQQTAGRSSGLDQPVYTRKQRRKTTASVLGQANLAAPDEADAGGSHTALSAHIMPAQPKSSQSHAQVVGPSQPVASVKSSSVSRGGNSPFTPKATGHADAECATQQHLRELSASEAAHGDQQRLSSTCESRSESGEAITFSLFLCCSSVCLLFPLNVDLKLLR